MRFGFIRPGSMAQAIASEFVPALWEAAGAERVAVGLEESP